MKKVLLALLAFANAAVAAAPWPKVVVPASEIHVERATTATLPPALREALLSFDEFTQGGDALPETLQIFRFDLNQNGTAEFFVASAQSYSGGTAWIIYEETEQRFRDIGYLQGGFAIVAPYNDYYQLESWGRAGGGELTRTLSRFERGRYRLARIEDFTDDDEPRFIRSRDAKEYNYD